MAPTVQPGTIQRDTATMAPHLKKLAPEAQTREYIYKSKLPPIDINDSVPLATYVLERARSSQEQARRTCIIAHGGRRYSYGDVAELTRRLAAGLATAGVGRGDVVMLLLPNCAEFMLAFLAIVDRGAVATTANPFYTAREVAKQAAASRATMVITSKAFLPKLADLGPNQATVVLVDTGDDGGNGSVTRFQDLFLDGDELEAAEAMLQGEPPVEPDDVAALPYSSGTTGLPKGVMLTHRGLVTSVAQQVDGDNPNIYWTPDDVVLCVLPLFHIYSLNSVFLCSLRVGATVVIMPKFDIVDMLGLIQEHRITIAPFVPPIVLALAKNPVVDKYDLSSVRMAISGAAPLGKDLEDSFRARLPRAMLGQGYGMTEAGPVLAMNLAFAKEAFPVKAGSCGTIVRNAEAKVVDPETGVSLPHNHSGEICIRGTQIMKGYLNDPDSTALTIDKEGWLHTGDVGYIDEDEEVFLVDRVKEIIKYKGFQVAPAEIEAILVSHKAVADAAVISKKDETAGELPVAFVVRSNGSQTSEDELKQFVAQQVVFYKKLHSIYFVDSIPKSPSGKIIRKDLRNRPELLL